MPAVSVPQWTKEVWDHAFIDYVKAQRSLDRDLARILRKAALEARGIEDHLAGIDTVSARVRRLQMQASSRYLDGIADEMWAGIEDEVTAQLLTSSDIAINGQDKMLRQLLRMGGSREVSTELARSFTIAARQAAENVRSRLINAIPISRDVTRNSKLARSVMQREINNGIALGKSAREIASSVVNLINPNTPGGASFAAMRIGRTELNNAFHTTTVRAIADRPWVEGAKWILSDSHPRPDECNDYAHSDHAGMGAGIFPSDSIPGKPHPQCLCYIVVVTVSPEHFNNQLLAGRYDSFLVSHGQTAMRG